MVLTLWYYDANTLFVTLVLLYGANTMMLTPYVLHSSKDNPVIILDARGGRRGLTLGNNDANTLVLQDNWL